MEQATKAYDAQVKTLRRKFANLGADKAAGTYVLVCKSHLARQMMAEVTTTKTYENAETQEIKVIVSKHEKYVVREQRLAEHQQQDEHGNDIIPKYRVFNKRIPVFGVSIKLHKKNIPRFMAKSHDTTLTQLSQWITKTLKVMVPVSEEIWRNLFLVAGIVTDGS